LGIGIGLYILFMVGQGGSLEDHSRTWIQSVVN